MKFFEYRIGWSASSNINFHGYTDWIEWGDAESEEEVHRAQEGDNIRLSDGLEWALSESGFEWWVEVREMNDEV